MCFYTYKTLKIINFFILTYISVIEIQKLIFLILLSEYPFFLHTAARMDPIDIINEVRLQFFIDSFRNSINAGERVYLREVDAAVDLGVIHNKYSSKEEEKQHRLELTAHVQKRRVFMNDYYNTMLEILDYLKRGDFESIRNLLKDDPIDRKDLLDIWIETRKLPESQFLRLLGVYSHFYAGSNNNIYEDGYDNIYIRQVFRILKVRAETEMAGGTFLFNHTPLY